MAKRIGASINAQCQRKIRYRSRDEAEQASTNNPQFEAYRCGFCDGYHVGHAKRPVMRPQVLQVSPAEYFGGEPVEKYQ